MPDVFTKEQRSKVMSHIRGKDNKPETMVRRYLWHHHYGCKYGRYPQSRKEYWIKHINRNVENDVKNYNLLQQLDYKVIVVWECEIKEDFDHRMKLLIEEITQ